MTTARLTARLPLLRLYLPLGRWIAVHRQRTDLGQLNDHLLADIGLTPEDAQRESLRHFWDL